MEKNKLISDSANVLIRNPSNSVERRLQSSDNGDDSNEGHLSAARPDGRFVCFDDYPESSDSETLSTSDEPSLNSVSRPDMNFFALETSEKDVGKSFAASEDHPHIHPRVTESVTTAAGRSPDLFSSVDDESFYDISKSSVIEIDDGPVPTTSSTEHCECNPYEICDGVSFGKSCDGHRVNTVCCSVSELPAAYVHKTVSTTNALVTSEEIVIDRSTNVPTSLDIVSIHSCEVSTGRGVVHEKRPPSDRTMVTDDGDHTEDKQTEMYRHAEAVERTDPFGNVIFMQAHSDAAYDNGDGGDIIHCPMFIAERPFVISDADDDKSYYSISDDTSYCSVYDSDDCSSLNSWYTCERNV